jgi:hypothetical protein
MSIRAGSIVTVAGRNVVDRLQSAGLGDARIPVETIREVGNDLVVDKVPGEPDFTFSMESWDVTTDMLAFLTGKIGTQAANDPPGAADPAGTRYRWEAAARFLNIVSPWKDNPGTQGGNIGAGLLIPNYFPTRLRYRFGVTDNAVQEVELAGGSFYYAQRPPVEEYATGDGLQAAFVTTELARAYRMGGSAGTTFQRVFGVIVDGRIQVKGVDYVESVAGGTPAGDPALTTITFQPGSIPAAGAQVRFCYFTETDKAYPQAVNADVTIKPGAVRGRNIHLYLDPWGVNRRLGGIQSVEVEATLEGENDREMGNAEIIGRTVNGTDATGTVNVRPAHRQAFFRTLEDVTGVAGDEVFGYFNQFSVPVLIKIENPKNPGQILKSLYFHDGQFQPPGTPARVNQATDFGFQFNSVNGTFSEFKGDLVANPGV